MRPELRNRHSDSLRAGRSGDRILVQTRYIVLVQIGHRAHQASCAIGTGSFPGVKWPGRGIDHTPSSAHVKEREVPYIYSPLVLRGLL
jgi:hypothetical protein